MTDESERKKGDENFSDSPAGGEEGGGSPPKGHAGLSDAGVSLESDHE